MKLIKTLTLAGIFFLASCSTMKVSNRDIAFDLNQSHRVVRAGEVVTYTADATGHDWSRGRG